MRGPGFVLHLNTENRTLKTLNHNPLTLALSPAGERGQLQESRGCYALNRAGFCIRTVAGIAERYWGLLLDLERSLHQFDGGVAR